MCKRRVGGKTPRCAVCCCARTGEIGFGLLEPVWRIVYGHPRSTSSLTFVRSGRCDFVDLVQSVDHSVVALPPQNGFCIHLVALLQGFTWAPFCTFAHCVSASYPSAKQTPCSPREVTPQHFPRRNSSYRFSHTLVVTGTSGPPYVGRSRQFSQIR
jgi:hypothetical protein